jgi:hypothetical protein
MFIQISVGTGLILLSVFVAALGFLVFELILSRSHSWLIRPPHRFKMAIVLGCAVIAVLWMITAGVWIWAFAFELLGLFSTFEEGLYFALVAFTTLGFGDLLLPENWRLLGGMCATNGLLNIGMMTALLMEVLRHVRRNQLGASASKP